MPGAMTTPFGCNYVLRGPARAPIHLRALRQEPADSLERRPTPQSFHPVPGLDPQWRRSPRPPPHPPAGLQPVPQPSLSPAPSLQTPNLVHAATPFCRVLFEEGRVLTHIVLNRDKCKVRLHLWYRHLTTAVLQDSALDPGLGHQIRSGFSSLPGSPCQTSTRDTFRSLWAPCFSICGFEWWWNLDLRIPKAGFRK